MPIGKNAIKRVANNGYSNVKTTAPDMENSVIEESVKSATKKAPAKNPVPKAVTSKNKSVSSSRLNPAPKAAIMIDVAQKKPSLKKIVEKAEIKEEKMPDPTPKKSMETEPELAPLSTLEKVSKASERDGDGYTNLGGTLPYYLL